MAEPSSGLTNRTVTSDGVKIHCVTAGRDGDPMVLLLHGFPARWSTWRGPMRALAAAGLFAVAPDLRGYGESDRPAGLAAYSAQRLVDDVAAVVRGFGREKACLAGHDFGGGVAWAAAMTRPELVSRLAVLNSVHPVGFERQLRRWSQLKKSWYVFFFQLPWLPEWLLARGDHRVLRRSLDAALAEPPPDWVSAARVVHIPDASHWVHHDAPGPVGALLVEHFGGESGRA